MAQKKTVDEKPAQPGEAVNATGQSYEKVRWEFILEAQEPIAHHSESMGNTAIAMRQKTRLADGSFVSVPIITGDTIRHQLREAASYALLDAAGMKAVGASNVCVSRERYEMLAGIAAAAMADKEIVQRLVWEDEK
jgi:hypothetical protein